tara:strand:- start:164 stop:295 length:132 start_codon:yes stop_codon:yes gene_type:complete
MIDIIEMELIEREKKVNKLCKMYSREILEIKLSRIKNNRNATR